MSFPLSPLNGELYTTPLGTCYQYNNTDGKWIIVGSSVAGVQGITGLQGIQGDTGLQGETGIQGTTGVQGATGVQGVQGDTGVHGITGVQGITGLQAGTILSNGMYVVGGTIVKEDAFDIDYGTIPTLDSSVTTTAAPNHYAANWTGLAISANGLYQTAVATDNVPAADYIYTSNDCGTTWTKQTGTGAFYFSDVAMSADGKIQTAVVNNSATGYIYTSSDYGATWTQRGTDIGWTAVDMSATGQFQTAVTANGLPWTSIDYGVTWVIASASTSNWTDIAMTSDGKTQIASTVGNIWTSTDYGVNWTEQTTGSPFNLGTRNWQRVGMSSDGKTQFIADDTSGATPPLDTTLYVSNDYGVTWTVQIASETLTWGDVCISKDGKIILAAIYGGEFYYSINYGSGWSPLVLANQNWIATAISSDGRISVVGIDGLGLTNSIANLKAYGHQDIQGSVNITNQNDSALNIRGSDYIISLSGNNGTDAPGATGIVIWFDGTNVKATRSVDGLSSVLSTTWS